jgi:hypothetical protein
VRFSKRTALPSDREIEIAIAIEVRDCHLHPRAGTSAVIHDVLHPFDRAVLAPQGLASVTVPITVATSYCPKQFVAAHSHANNASPLRNCVWPH